MAFRGKPKFRDQLSDEDKIYVYKLRTKMNAGFGFPDGATEVFDFLYLGGADEATDMHLLEKLGITHVINCAAGYCGTGEKFYGDSVRRYVEFHAEDDDNYNMLQHFDATHDAIEEARQSGGRALIHCMMGVNRSGVLAVAYAMVHRGWGPITAAVYIRARRKWLLSNEAFQAQLITFARQRQLLHLDDAEFGGSSGDDAKSKSAQKL